MGTGGFFDSVLPAARDMAEVLVKTRFGMGSLGKEIPAFRKRFDDDPRVLEIRLVRKNMAMGIPGWVEGTIAARSDLSGEDAADLLRSVSEQIRLLDGSDADVRPLDVTFGSVSVQVDGNPSLVEMSVPVVRQALDDASVVVARIAATEMRGGEGKPHQFLGCSVTVAEPDQIRGVLDSWPGCFPQEGRLSIRDATGEFTSTWTPYRTEPAQIHGSGDIPEEMRQLMRFSGGLTIAAGTNVKAVTPSAELPVSGDVPFVRVADGQDLSAIAQALDEVSPEFGYDRVAIGANGNRVIVQAEPGRVYTKVMAMMDARRAVLTTRKLHYRSGYFTLHMFELPDYREMSRIARHLKPVLEPGEEVRMYEYHMPGDEKADELWFSCRRSGDELIFDTRRVKPRGDRKGMKSAWEWAKG